MTRFELTKREKDVLVLKILGLGDKEIAKKLSISYGTVRTHIERAKIKWGCSSTIQLLLLANSYFNEKVYGRM